MNNNSPHLDQFSPHKLLTGFTRSRFWMWMVMAIAVHVLFIGALSLGYIRDNYIDPEGAQARKTAAEAAAKAEAEKNAPKPPVSLPPDTAAATNAAPTNAVAATFAPATNSLPDIPEDRKDTAVVKAITAVAQTNEIPKMPDDLGLSIRDTQIR